MISLVSTFSREIDERTRGKYERLLNRMEYLSVREDTRSSINSVGKFIRHSVDLRRI